MIDSFANLAHCVAVTSAWERVANNATTEGATAPETLRSRDRTDDKTLESGFLVKGLKPRRRSKRKTFKDKRLCQSLRSKGQQVAQETA